MRTLFSKFWHDDRGSVPATEWMLVASLLTLSALAGLLALHHAGDDCPEYEPPALMR